MDYSFYLFSIFFISYLQIFTICTFFLIYNDLSGMVLHLCTCIDKNIPSEMLTKIQSTVLTPLGGLWRELYLTTVCS